MPAIQNELSKIRQAAIRADVFTLSWLLYTSGIVSVLCLILLESVFYFSPQVRYGIWITAAILVLLGLSAAAVLGILIVKNKIYRYTWSGLSRRTGSLAFKNTDDVLNALQLERSAAQSQSKELSASFISSVLSDLKQLDLATLFPLKRAERWQHITLATLVGSLLVLSLTWTHSSEAVFRWAHPRTSFPVPTPFSITNKTGHIHLLGGDPAEIVFSVQDGEPDSVYLSLTPAVGGVTELYAAGIDSSSSYTFQLKEVFQDYAYQGFVPAKHFWQSWDRVETHQYDITVTDRPMVEFFSIKVIPPPYTKLPAITQEGQQANVEGVYGSNVTVKLSSNRPLKKGQIYFQQDTLLLAVRGKKAEGTFVIKKDDSFSIHLEDRRGIHNRNPVPYRLYMIPDLHPELSIIEPPPVVELGSDQMLSLKLNMKDDYGFTTLQVGYEIQRPSYIQADPMLSIFSIPIPDPDVLNQELETLWNLSDLGLMPEDEVHYHFELYDNDLISGPKKALSGTYIARIPSLSDLFASFNESEDKILDAAVLNAEDVDNVKDKLDKAELELRKAESLEWDQEQQIRKSMEKVREQVEMMQRMADQLEALTNSAEKHQLFSPQLLEKFEQLQSLVNELMNEDFMQSMDKVDQALSRMDVKDLSAAMKNMSQNLEKLEADLDRFIDIFKQVHAEQKMEELKTRLEALADMQEELSEKIEEYGSDAEPSEFARMSQEEQRLKEEFSNIDRVMKEAEDALTDIHPPSADQLNSLKRSQDMAKTRLDFGRTIQQLNQRNAEDAAQSSAEVQKDLQNILDQVEAIQQNFQQQTANQIAGEFRNIMRDILTLSKSQENLTGKTQLLSRNSPQLQASAVEQLMLQDQLKQIMDEMIALSKKTFAISPEMGKAMGMTYAQMESAKKKLAERNNSGAKGNQDAAMKSLNDAALTVMNAINDVQSSGSASGFEQFLKRMEQLAGQQDGLNQQGMQLAMGQMAASLQQALMQRMLQQQKGVRKSLQELADEMRGSSNKGLGDLSGIANEMDDVIHDLERRRFTKKTAEKQERILSRMLDSQKSLAQKGTKEERTSETAELISYAGPGGLPNDLGQRRNLAIEALNRAMQSGYSRDYKAMIRRYFQSISQNDDIIQEPAVIDSLQETAEKIK